MSCPALPAAARGLGRLGKGPPARRRSPPDPQRLPIHPCHAVHPCIHASIRLQVLGVRRRQPAHLPLPGHALRLPPGGPPLLADNAAAACSLLSTAPALLPPCFSWAPPPPCTQCRPREGRLIFLALFSAPRSPTAAVRRVHGGRRRGHVLRVVAHGGPLRCGLPGRVHHRVGPPRQRRRVAVPHAAGELLALRLGRAVTRACLLLSLRRAAVPAARSVSMQRDSALTA